MADVMLAKYELSKTQNASQNLGNNRELFCNEFLSSVIPHKLRISNGEIIDSKGNKTGQIDTLIVKEDTPCLAFGTSNTYLAEGVFSTIEVKSNLTRAKVSESIKTLKKVSCLELNFEGLIIVGKMVKDPDNDSAILGKPLKCIFAYESASWETIIDEILENNALNDVDVVSVLNKGILFRNGLWFESPKETKYHTLNGKAASLGILYFFLSTFSGSFISRNISLRKYFEPFEEWSTNGFKQLN